MGFVEIFMIGVGLSMDAFSVAVCKGLGMKKVDYRQTCIIALFFGGFQALMPFLGWALGRQFEKYITAFDHWIAFGLLLFIGGKMIVDVLRGGDEEKAAADAPRLNIKELLLLAIATSIDALAMGITFGLQGVSIVPAITMIGVTTFVLSFVGVLIGNRFGARFLNKATVAGGIVLILIGVKILLEDLGVFARLQELLAK